MCSDMYAYLFLAQFIMQIYNKLRKMNSMWHNYCVSLPQGCCCSLHCVQGCMGMLQSLRAKSMAVQSSNWHHEVKNSLI